MKQGPFPRRRFCCPRGSSGTTSPSATLPTRRDFAGLPLIRAHCFPNTLPQARGRGGLPQFPHPPSRPFRSLYPGGFIAAAHPGSSRLPWPSPSTPGSAPPLQTNGAAGFASRYGPDRSHAPTGRLTLGSDAGRFPPTPPACYPAPWHLPGPDSHRQADASLCPDQITECITSELWAHNGAFMEPRVRNRWQSVANRTGRKPA